ncbi:MAG: hypothetical protein EPO21_24420 [Chloroflexota bacterium]|nr:MAG: hypothetical protein EPO21_24420 [Chloroflexota bacterium]
MSENGIAVLVAHPKAARFEEFRRRWREGRLPALPADEVTIAFTWIKRPEDLKSQVVAHRPHILVVHGSLLGDQPAYAAMWVLTQGAAGVLITDDSDPSRHFETKRCHVLPVQGAPEATAAALGLEVRRVQQERAQRAG